jgi:hypothetical protein
VLGRPDGQYFYEEQDAYKGLVEARRRPLPIADAPEQGTVWLISNGELFSCAMQRHRNGPLWLSAAEQPLGTGDVRLADPGRSWRRYRGVLHVTRAEAAGGWSAAGSHGPSPGGHLEGNASKGQCQDSRRAG